MELLCEKGTEKSDGPADGHTCYLDILAENEGCMFHVNNAIYGKLQKASKQNSSIVEELSLSQGLLIAVWFFLILKTTKHRLLRVCLQSLLQAVIRYVHQWT